MIYLYTGNGAGKTTAALGLAMRSLGHGHKVVVIQYMKGRKNIGEYKIQKYLKNYKVYQFGSPKFIKPITKAKNLDKQLAYKGLKSIDEIIKKEKPKLLILDEINLATSIGLLDTYEVLETIKRIPKSIDVVLTGRYAPKRFIDMADYVNKVEFIKQPQKMTSKKGINY